MSTLQEKVLFHIYKLDLPVVQQYPSPSTLNYTNRIGAFDITLSNLKPETIMDKIKSFDKIANTWKSVSSGWFSSEYKAFPNNLSLKWGSTTNIHKQDLVDFINSHKYNQNGFPITYPDSPLQVLSESKFLDPKSLTPLKTMYMLHVFRKVQNYATAGNKKKVKPNQKHKHKHKTPKVQKSKKSQ